MSDKYVTVPVNSRGNFFTDPYFETARENIQRAKKEAEKFKDSNQQSASSKELTDLLLKLHQQSLETLFASLSTPTTSTAKDKESKASSSENKTRAKNDCCEKPCPMVAEKTAGKSSDRYQITIDVKGFPPKNVMVNAVNNILDVYAVQDTIETGKTPHSIRQRFTLPDGVDPKTLKGDLSCDGTLVITAPLKKK